MPAASTSTSATSLASDPRIPPLPYWVGGVAVVGLPSDQLVFCFRSPAELAALKRQQLRPEACYGAGAARLALLLADQAQAVLDRWQRAASQRELDGLDARQLMWFQYEAACEWQEGSSGCTGGQPPAAAFAEELPVPTPQQQEQQQQPTSAARASADSPRSGAGAGRAGGQAPGRLLTISSGAFQPWWQVCTVRGRPDGCLLYSFGGGKEPLLHERGGPEEERQDGAQRLELQPLEGVPWSSWPQLGLRHEDQVRLVCWLAGWMGGCRRRFVQRAQRPACLPDQLHGCLPMRPHAQARDTLVKLQDFLLDWQARQQSGVALGPMHPTYTQREQQWASERAAAPGSGGAAGQPAAAAPAGMGGEQQPQQRWRRQRTSAAADPSTGHSSGKPALESGTHDASPAAAGQPEAQWHDELLPRPLWQPPPAAPPAPAQLCSTARAPQPSEQRRLWLVVTLLRAAAAAFAAFWLGLYRRLPVGFRSLFWAYWPPRVSCCREHASCMCTLDVYSPAGASGVCELLPTCLGLPCPTCAVVRPRQRPAGRAGSV